MRFSDLKRNNSSEPEKEEALPRGARPGRESVLDSDIPAPGKKAEPEEKKTEPEQPVSREAAEPQKEEIFFSIRKEQSPVSPPPESFIGKEPELSISAKAVYSKALEISKELFSSLDKPYFEKYSELNYAVRSLLKEISSNPFFPAVIKYLTPSNYLYTHSLNVAIITLGVCRAAGFEEEMTARAGLAAFLHDIGMKDCMELARLERKLNDGEKEAVRRHVLSGVEKLDRIMDFDYNVKASVAELIAQSHERADGSGYPRGLRGEEIDDCASVIGAADLYEALIHVRPWREALEPSAAIKFFIDEYKPMFKRPALKGIISFFSMYPPNSVIRLSSGEIGVVVASNPGNFMRPLVKVVMDVNFRELEPYYLDLVQYPLTNIEEEISYSELAARNPGFFSDFEMASLWLEW